MRPESCRFRSLKFIQKSFLADDNSRFIIVFRVFLSPSQVSAAIPREEVVEDIRLKLMAVTEFSS